MVSVTELFSESWSSLKINQQEFMLYEEEYDEYDSEGKTITFYKKDKEKKEKNEKKSSLFSFVLNDATGGCNDKSIEKGVYDVNGTTLTFYTLWKRQGSVDDAPFGGRVKRYEVLKNGEVNLTSSLLYVETHTEDSDEGSGMLFLNTKPKSKEDKELLAEYVASVENYYRGKFVFGEESDMLIKKVRKAIRRHRKDAWKKR
jgi:hypothetical protein